MHFFYRSTALCIGHLREMGVTAVLNAAQGSMTDWNYVNTKAIYYTGVGIQFLGVPAIDLKWYPICNHFQEASDFIEEVVKSKGMLKFIYSEKATKFCEIFTLLLTGTA